MKSLDSASFDRFRLLGAIAMATVLLVAGIIAIRWAYDVWQDRKHTVVVTAETPLFVGERESCSGTRIATLPPGTEPKVMRIRYWKNCATIDVVSPSGQQGFIVLGEGSVSVKPPLP